MPVNTNQAIFDAILAGDQTTLGTSPPEQDK